MFGLFHTQKGISMDTTTGILNDYNKKFLKKNKHVSRQSFSSRMNNLPETFFKNVCTDVYDLIDKKYKKKSNQTYEICAVDGSDCNNSKSLAKEGFKTNKNGNTVTTLNIGIYNVTRNYPVDITMVKHKNERKAFIDCVTGRKDFSNTIFVFDKGFDGINFLKKLDKLNLKYVCRIRDNSSLITKSVDSVQNCAGCKTRIIKYKIGTKNYNLATNLFDTEEFTINRLKQIYHERWTIEECFKYMKRNFDFGTSELESAVELEIQLSSNLCIE